MEEKFAPPEEVPRATQMAEMQFSSHFHLSPYSLVSKGRLFLGPLLVFGPQAVIHLYRSNQTAEGTNLPFWTHRGRCYLGFFYFIKQTFKLFYDSLKIHTHSHMQENTHTHWLDLLMCEVKLSSHQSCARE